MTGPPNPGPGALPVSRRDGWLAAAGLGLVLVGLAFRLALFTQNRSFWGDEVSVAFNVRTRDALGLLHPLDFHQTMPILLLLGVKLLTAILGNGDWVFRLPSLVAGLGLLILLWRRFPPVVGRIEGLLMLAFAAVWWPLLYYASELKQYAVDAAVSAMLLVTALELLRAPEVLARWRRMLGFGVVGLLLSQPSVFILTSVGAALLLDRRVWEVPERRRRTVACGAIWVAIFAVLFVAFYLSVADSGFMQHYWKEAFFTPGAGWLERAKSAIWTIAGADQLPQARTLVLSALLGWGAWSVYRKHGLPVLALLLLPYAAMLAASSVGLYPIAGRLLLFLIPIYFWLLAAALVGLAERLPGPTKVLAGLLFLWLWIPPAVRGIRAALHPPEREATRHMADRIRQIEPAAPVLVAFGGYLSWVYYTADWRGPEEVLRRATRGFDCAFRPGEQAGCELAGSDSSGFSPPAVVGIMPSASPGDQADAAWARREIERLRQTGAPRAWIVYPLYPETFRPRHLAERLRMALRAAGGEITDSLTIGESTLLRVTLP